MPPLARIVHQTPHRTRLRTRGMRRDTTYFTEVKHAIEQFEAVGKVHVQSGTESILIEHSDSIDEVLSELQERGYFKLETPDDVAPYLARVGQGLEQGDRQMLEATGGRLGLDTLVFIGFIGSGIYQVTQGRGLPAGVTLLRYAIEMTTAAGRDWAMKKMQS